jgi:hypothetical protein
MKRYLILALVLLSSPIAAEGLTPGNYQLDRLVRDGQTFQDPRWQMWVWLGADGTFQIRSHHTTESRLSNGKVKPSVEEFELAGRYKVKEGVLKLTFSEAPTGPGSSFASRYLSCPSGTSSGQARLLPEPGLVLGTESVELYFLIHEKTDR